MSASQRSERQKSSALILRKILFCLNDVLCTCLSPTSHANPNRILRLAWCADPDVNCKFKQKRIANTALSLWMTLLRYWNRSHRCSAEGFGLRNTSHKESMQALISSLLFCKTILLAPVWPRIRIFGADVPLIHPSFWMSLQLSIQKRKQIAQREPCVYQPICSNQTGELWITKTHAGIGRHTQTPPLHTLFGQTRGFTNMRWHERR